MAQNKQKSTAIAIGTALAGSIALGTANAAENPFGMTELSGGYMQVAMSEGKCGEGKCGGKKEESSEGKCGGKKEDSSEGKCGEGKCGGNK